MRRQIPFPKTIHISLQNCHRFHDHSFLLFLDVINAKPLRSTFKNLNFESKDELRKAMLNLSFTVENKKGNLHK